MLSNTEQWTQDDGYFDMYEFIKTIIELFEDEEVGSRSNLVGRDAQVVERVSPSFSTSIIHGFSCTPTTSQIFCKSAAQNSTPTSPRSGQNETTRSRLMEQRRAKRQCARPD